MFILHQRRTLLSLATGTRFHSTSGDRIDVGLQNMINILQNSPPFQTSTPSADTEFPSAGPDGYPPPDPPKRKKKSLFAKYLSDVPRYRLHVFSNRNNTITTFTKPDGGAVAWVSSGSCGFKNVQRSTYEAGYQCAVRIFNRIEELSATTPMEIDLFFKGFGLGRDAVHRALLTTEGEKVRPLVVSITDRTAIKIGGTRSKKQRRL